MKSKLPEWDLAHKKILVRADLNVPIKKGIIADDYRLQALLPTLNFIREKGGSIILVTHLGRPKDKEKNLSTQLLVPWFKKHGYNISFAPDIETAQKLSQKNTLVLLENARFFPGEKNHDQKFAQQLATLGDYYVNDAFALMHRNDTSITDAPKLFPNDQRSIGLLVEKELTALNTLLESDQPCIAILGGEKVASKLPFLKNLLTHIDTLLLCPAIVFTFLKGQGESVGKSLVDNESIPLCEEILKHAQKLNVKVEFPQDYQVAKDNLDGPLSIVNAHEIPSDAMGIAIGPKTVDAWSTIIEKASIIFFNGAMGFLDRPETLHATEQIFKAMADSQGLSIVGGGSSVAIARHLNIGNQLDYLSTGGGATLAYLSGQDLPGLQVFKK